MFSMFRMQCWMQIKEILLFEVGFVQIDKELASDQGKLISTIILRGKNKQTHTHILENLTPPLSMEV